ncbi:TMEM175 family protein [Aestuariimicrobium soli]|uniref:TMEM175 family protein n=1 Tax=Aestuariimicrobium soli TaxID=2035834 RepID=UPI003EBBF829
MPQQSDTDTEPFERDPQADRLIAFTDAAVAIALTLLVLPLMEAVADPEETDLVAWLQGQWPRIFAFVMSFALVAVYWSMHHSAMKLVRRFEGRMLVANFLWLFAIVILPVTSTVSIAFENSPLQAAIYVGDLLLIVIALAWIEIETMRHPEVETSNPQQVGRLAATAASALLLVLAWVIIVTTPLGYLGMLTLCLIGPLQRVLKPVIGKVMR